MELQNMSREIATAYSRTNDEDSMSPPGFRFHPTDQELVGFYLRRKIDNRPIRIELIKQADIYKYDPWDLPKLNNVGDREWYFFSKRGRKYKNSIRPNRVTGSGFWKATGIDKPIYSSGVDGRCIGLKKSLVYYRGSAGKGTKTEWMMHEFRLPAMNPTTNIDQEAEVWTLCRILKRSVATRKFVIPDWRVTGGKRRGIIMNPAAFDSACSMESPERDGQSMYISFSAPAQLMMGQYDKKPYKGEISEEGSLNFSGAAGGTTEVVSEALSALTTPISDVCGDVNEWLMREENWDDLQSFVDCTASLYTTITTTTTNIDPLYP